MDKITRFFPSVLFCLYFIKLMIVGSSFSDAAVLAILAAWAIVIEIKISDKKTKEVLEQVQAMTELHKLTEAKVKSLGDKLAGYTMMRK